MNAKRRTFTHSDTLLQPSNPLSSCFYGNLRYPISFYVFPPLEGTVLLQNLIDAAIDRLESATLQYKESIVGHATVTRCLDAIDTFLQAISARGELDKNLTNKISELCRNHDFMIKDSDPSSESKWKVAFKDAISHFLLKLAFGKQAQHREWFLKQEETLMDFKFSQLYNDSLYKQNDMLHQFLKNQDMDFRIIEDPALTGKSEDRELWNLCTKFKSDKSISDKITRLYEVKKFSDISFLVRSRQIYINNMIGYVTNTDLRAVVLSRFRKVILESFSFLDERSVCYEHILANPRLAEFLRILPISSAVNNYSKLLADNETFRLTTSNISQAWIRSFPPCMQRLYQALKRDGHLKHWGRQQFWLFLKDAGLPMEDSIMLNRSLWKEQAVFDKEFRYTLRHLYGQEGKRVSRDAYSCSKILGGSLPLTGVGEYHGCPFKVMDSEPLRKMLMQYGLDYHSFDEINTYKMNHEYQVACTKVFRARHPKYEDGPIGNHPNVFFMESLKFFSKIDG